MTTRSDIEGLEESIRIGAQAYYSGECSISDQLFDSFVEELRTLSPKSEILKKIGWGYTPVAEHLKKRAHDLVYSGMSKLKKEDLDPSKPCLEGPVIASLKLDGGDATAYYDSMGNLRYVLSRGDGTIGLDVTQNLMPGGTIPRKIDNGGDVIMVRGQIMITIEANEALGGASPRNKAVGLSQSKSSSLEELRLLKFVAFSVATPGRVINPKIDHFGLLESWNFSIPRYQLFQSWEHCRTNWLDGSESQEWREGRSTASRVGNILIDGIIVNSNKDASDEKMIAYKFTPAGAKTKVRKINWKMSRTGRLVPVLSIDPVALSGATIYNVTANNAKWLAENGLGVGATILVVRSGEVIPKVAETIEPVTPEFPSICPVCFQSLVRKGVDLHCENTLCEAKVETTIIWILESGKPLGIGGHVISKLIEEFDLKSLLALRSWVSTANIDFVQRNIKAYVFDESLLSAEYGTKTLEKIETMLHNIRTMKVSVAQLLNYANIPNMGDVSCKAIQQNVSFEEFKKAILTGNIPESWDKHGSTYLAFEGIKSHIGPIRKLIGFFGLQFIDKGSEEGTASEKNPPRFIVEMTGKFSKTKKELLEDWKEFGVIHGKLKNADYLICNQLSGSAKCHSAVKSKTPIVTESEFQVILSDSRQ